MQRVRKTVNSLVKDIVCSKIGVDPELVDTDEELKRFGLDSIMILEITESLEQHFGELPKTMFFEYRCIDEVTEYLVSHYTEAAQQLTLRYTAESNLSS